MNKLDCAASYMAFSRNKLIFLKKRGKHCLDFSLSLLYCHILTGYSKQVYVPFLLNFRCVLPLHKECSGKLVDRSLIFINQTQKRRMAGLDVGVGGETLQHLNF